MAIVILYIADSLRGAIQIVGLFEILSKLIWGMYIYAVQASQYKYSDNNYYMQLYV